MIVVDTNILSDLLRPAPEPRVVRWLDAQPLGIMATTAVTKAEMIYGVERLPEGQRRRALTLIVSAIMERFAGRILPFDEAAAAHYASIVIARRKMGRPIEPLDAQIVAIAAAHGAAVATRDRDMRDCGIPLINPWND